MCTNRKKPAYYIHDNGFIMPKGFPVDNFNSSLTYQPEPGDIFICTYPKCGTTWTQFILYLLYNKGKPLDKALRISDVIPHLEEVGRTKIESLPRPRIIKTHLRYNLTPKSSEAKYVFIARNPKDCCVSFYHHTKGFPRHYDFLDGKFEDFFDLFVKGEVDFGDYFDHLLSWHQHRNDGNVLLVLYEEMRNNAKDCIKKIGEFLGGSFSESCKDETILSEVLQKSSFDSMKKTPEAWSSSRPKEVAGFLRKGEVGDWREYFSDQQIKILDDKLSSKLSGTDAEHLWDNFDC